MIVFAFHSSPFERPRLLSSSVAQKVNNVRLQFVMNGGERRRKEKPNVLNATHGID